MAAEQKKSKTTNIALWMVQGLLALTLLWSGFMKIVKPEDLPFAWVKDNPNLVLFTGVLDLFAGIGIVLPALLRIKPTLTIFAAYGIIALMISASAFHVLRGEANDIGFNIFMLLCALFVAWGRQKKVPLADR